MSVALSSARVVGSGSPTQLSRKFSVGIALAMLTVNLVGFGPTLYLRPFFDVPPIPFYLYLHGAIGTAWFVLLVGQALLIATRNFRQHRQLGWVGVALAASVVLLGMYTSTHMVPRNVALGADSEAELSLFALVTAADLASFVLIPTLVGLAVVFRRRMDVHMRLLLIATLVMLGPAEARIASWFGDIPNPVLTVIQLAFVASLFAHDIVVRRRPHIATVLGILFMMAVNAAFQLSGIGTELVLQRLGD